MVLIVLCIEMVVFFIGSKENRQFAQIVSGRPAVEGTARGTPASGPEELSPLPPKAAANSGGYSDWSEYIHGIKQSP